MRARMVSVNVSATSILPMGINQHVPIHADSSSAVNNLQGINGFGGQLGNVQSNFYSIYII